MEFGNLVTSANSRNEQLSNQWMLYFEPGTMNVVMADIKQGENIQWIKKQMNLNFLMPEKTKVIAS
jgi:hypothetical protein